MADKENVARWDIRIKAFLSVVSLADGPEVQLQLLGKMLRTVETTRDRMSRWSLKLRPVIKKLMIEANISEIVVGRTLLRIDEVLNIPDNIPGEAVYQELISEIGPRRTRRFVKKTKTRTVIYQYNLLEEELEKLPPELRRKAKEIILRTRLACVPLPRRVRIGAEKQPRRRR